MSLINKITQTGIAAAKTTGKVARKGQVAAVRGGQAALGASYGLGSDVVQGAVGLGSGLIKTLLGSDPVKHGIVPGLGVSVPIGLKNSAMARMGLVGAAGAAAVGLATADNSEQATYQYPDEEDGVGPQYKRNLGADGNLVLQSYYAGRKY